MPIDRLMVPLLFFIILITAQAYKDEFAPVELRHQMIRLQALEPVLSQKFMRVSFIRQRSGEPVLMKVVLSPAFIDEGRDWKERLTAILRHILPQALRVLEKDCPPVLESVPLLSRLRCRIYIGQSLYGVWAAGRLEFRQGIY